MEFTANHRTTGDVHDTFAEILQRLQVIHDSEVTSLRTEVDQLKSDLNKANDSSHGAAESHVLPLKASAAKDSVDEERRTQLDILDGVGETVHADHERHCHFNFSDASPRARRGAGTNHVSAHVDREIFRALRRTESMANVDKISSVKLAARAAQLDRLNTSDKTRSSRKCPFLVEALDWTMYAVILINMGVMGVSADNYRDWRGWAIADLVVVTVFVFELLVKLYIRGCTAFYRDSDRWWNVFDAVILGVSIVDVSLTFRSTTSSYVRLLRVGRLARLVRFVRAPFFKEILMMVNGMVGSFRTLFWSLLLVCIPFYVVALVCRETLGRADADAHPVVHRMFKTVGESWLTVFRCMLGDCSDVNGTPIMVQINDHHGWGYTLGYCVLMIITHLAIFNMIAAIYVENFMDVAKSNEALMQRRRLHDTKRTAVMEQELFIRVVSAYCSIHRSDLDEMLQEEMAARIRITRDEFDTIMAEQDVANVFDQLDIPHDDRHGLFDVLDADGNDLLRMDEILNGVMRLRGRARRSDIVFCSLILRHVQAQVSTLVDLARRQEAFRSLPHPPRPSMERWRARSDTSVNL
eukprot:TRINITY_DN65662_c0_g1_i1.p1 TRINITY_DN65662_c0_g1~~TRINITY_DN65662_c0_g1_i1.p1  ORF type:complete len:592 (+),score=58.53 TRINITY_DN65662_c0_g1_i1:35-1777(+)